MRIYPFIKRAIDILVSLSLLVILSPILAISALIVLFAMGRPILFCQLRPGLNGRLFKMYKFRTMREPKASENRMSSDAKRLTPIGSLLRKTSMDELPELFNVLKGDMSLIGPRPLLPEYLPLYSPVQSRRHEVRPGITGWAQVNGRNAVDWPERFAMDVWYVDNLSFRLDIKIIFKTVECVFKSSGISAEGHATMPPFKGEEQ